ncbi:hypothetical protein XANCAGTX0491_001364 [Xanthoria calcicola]
MKDPLGILQLRNHLRAPREHRWPSLLTEILDSAGNDVHTASHCIFTQQMIYTRDVDNIKTILSVPSSHLVLGSSRGANFKPVAGDGLFTADGKVWEHYRASARPYFTQAKQISFIETLEALIQQRWRSLSVHNDDWTESLDLQSFFLGLTLDASMENLFGQSHSPQLSGTEKGGHLPDRSSFAASLDAASSFVGDRTVLGKMYWMKQSRDFHGHCDTIRGFVDHHIDGVYNPCSSPSTDEEDLKPSVAMEHQYHPTELRNRIQPLLFTGRNPSAALLAIIFFFLQQNLSIYGQLRNEIRTTFGLDGNVTLTKLATCQYLQFCILESLRLGNVVPAIMRSAEKDLVLPRGGGSDKQSPVLVPQGSTIIVCIQSLHLRKDLWGEDAASFVPERWHSRPWDWSFIPFSKGRRRCIGQQLAMNQAAYVVARFLQRFDSIQSVGGESTVKTSTDIATKFFFDKQMRFHLASSDTPG